MDFSHYERESFRVVSDGLGSISFTNGRWVSCYRHLEKPGVPITGLLQTAGTTVWQGNSFPSPTQKPHYAIGPVLDIRLPGQYSLEAGVMYKGIEQQARMSP
jgi:hypothetical protein